MRFKLPLILLLVVIIVIAGVLIVRSILPKNQTATTPPTTATLPAPAPSLNGIPVQSTTPVASVEDPGAFVARFYQWYLTNYSNAPAFAPYGERINDLATWLTPQFLAHCQSFKGHGPLDPITLSADYYPSWDTTIATTVQATSGTTATVTVFLGVGAELKKLDVSLIYTAGTWKVAGVILTT